jgi:hypothetical protein
MANITITNYDSANGIIFFQKTLIPLSANSVQIQKSTDAGLTFTLVATESGFITSPYSPYFFAGANLIRLFIPSINLYSNSFSTTPVVPSGPLPIASRTAITSAAQVTFVNSKIYLRNSTGVNANVHTVSLWVWTGSLNKTLGNPNFTLSKSKISGLDTYIQFEIQDFLKPFIDPKFAYNELTLPAVSGQYVFWQAIINGTVGNVIANTGTNIALLGNRWNYEQNFVNGNNGVSPNKSNPFIGTVNKWYNEKVHDYFLQSFDFTVAQVDANTSKIIITQAVTPPSAFTRCPLDPCLIVFLNKLGLWEHFTPNGKLFSQNKITFDTQNRSYRDESQLDNYYTHYKEKNNVEAMESYVLNTGSLDETMNETIKQIIFSPRVYLIKFKGDIIASAQVGITIDNTYVTIDDEIVTIDNAPISTLDVGFYKTHLQIPVIVTNTDFVEKTRLNEKNKIDYVINMDETSNKIL